jgi:hypothetical protein
MSRPKVIVAVVVLVLVASLGWVGLRSLSSDEPLATLHVSDRYVSLGDGSGRFVDVETSASLEAGSQIQTWDDALAEVRYFDGSLTRIGPDTTYEIVELEEEPDRTVIVGKIGLGETFHDVKRLTGSSSRFEIQESNAIASVRGTRFAARCLPPLPCGIAVVEGVVVVTPSSGDPVSVGAGRRVTIDDEGLLGEVADVSPDDPWLNRNRALDAPGARG